jgi:hypothetical protein
VIASLYLTSGAGAQQELPRRHIATGVRWEIFNLLNTTNFEQPDGNISNVTAGVISSADDARNMQFGLRLAW